MNTFKLSTIPMILLPFLSQAQDPAIAGIVPDKSPISVNEPAVVAADFFNGSSTAFAPSDQVVWTIHLGPSVEYQGTYTLEDATGLTLVDVAATAYSATAGTDITITTKAGVAFPGGTDPGGANTVYLNVKGKMLTAARDNMTIGAASNPNVSTNNTGNDVTGSFIEVIGILPLTLTSFAGRVEACDAVLGWATASEDGVSHFEVEYSAGGNSFAKVGEVAAGHPSGGSYSFRYGQTAGKAYYRLKMIDSNGSFTYSGVAQVTGGGCGTAITLYPNPAHDFVKVAGIRAGQHITVTDNAGSVIKKVEVTGSFLQISLSGYAAGTYLVLVTEAGKLVSTHRFVRQ